MRFEVALLAALAACSAPSGARLLPPASADTALQADCALAERRCSRCHPIDRVVVARIGAPADWRTTVERMRLLPASRISRAEAARIVRCLVVRSFGVGGLQAIEPARGGEGS